MIAGEKLNNAGSVCSMVPGGPRTTVPDAVKIVDQDSLSPKELDSNLGSSINKSTSSPNDETVNAVSHSLKQIMLCKLTSKMFSRMP